MRAVPLPPWDGEEVDVLDYSDAFKLQALRRNAVSLREVLVPHSHSRLAVSSSSLVPELCLVVPGILAVCQRVVSSAFGVKEHVK